VSYYQQKPQPRVRVPVPGLQRQVGLGDVVAGMTKAVGVKPCGGCKRRQAVLNRLLAFGRGR
jgi:hypothetical protein